jgi:hypothetical protein
MRTLAWILGIVAVAASLFVGIHDSHRARGPDINVVYAQERVEAAEQSLTVYKGIVGRDAQMAYAVGVLWLSFGFAFALSGRRSEQP